MGRMIRWVALAAVGLVLPSSALAAAAPPRVSSASFTQSARQLVWHVSLASPFSPLLMQRSGQSLCLMIMRVGNDSVSGVLCVEPSRDHRHPVLRYSPVTRRGRGRGRVIDATIARTSRSELTATFLPSQIDSGYVTLAWQVMTQSGPCGTRQGCSRVYPRRPAVLRMHVPRVVGCVPGGAPFVFHGPAPAGRVIALTFDDGPWYQTSQFLDLLEREHVVATFFEIGRQVGPYGQGGAIQRRMLADGDMIGDHTWDHANVSGGGSFAAGEIQSTAAAIRQATGGFTPCLFRAPGGAVSAALISEARSMGFTTIQWDVDPRDWSRPGAGAIYSNVVANAHNGAIVIQHDGGGDRSQTLAALSQEIATLRGRGYQFVTVTQLLGQSLIYK